MPGDVLVLDSALKQQQQQQQQLSSLLWFLQFMEIFWM